MAESSGRLSNNGGSKLPLGPRLGSEEQVIDPVRFGDSSGITGWQPDRSPGNDRDALYAEFRPLVRRLIRQYGENPELRQDLEGEIYCRFCSLLQLYDPSRGIPFRPYMVRMLTSSVYTYSRSQWRRQQREVSLDLGDESVEHGHAVDHSEQWNDHLMSREVVRVLPDAIARLPLRQRQVVIWRYYESRSFDEIAEALGIRPATARSLLRHGIHNLRKRILGADGD